MRTKLLYLLLLIASGFSLGAQNTWTTKASFPGPDRSRATGFFIQAIGKGYLGTGINCTVIKDDFWEWDEASNSWTQKANFGGGPREYAVGFAIGNKGYIGTGRDNSGNSRSDFWEYDPSSNTWTQRASLTGGARYSAVGFSIGSKGYIGTGSPSSGNYLNDFWEYDPSSDSWVQKAPFGGTGRNQAAGFAIGNKGYIGTGYNGVDHQDFWEWDQSANTWTQKANFGGGVRETAVAFSIGSKGYMGTGLANFSNYYDDFWEYDPSANTWIQKANYPTSVSLAVAFASCSKGYISTGKMNTCVYDNALREFKPSTINASQSSFCAGNCISFAYSSPITPVTWSWSFPGATPSTSVLSNPSNICYNTAGNYTATLTASDGTCSFTSTQLITVNGATTVPSSNTSVCSGNSTTISATGAVSYSWAPGGQTTSSITVSPSVTSTYTVTGTNSNGCTSSAPITVTVNQNPVVTATGSATICNGSSATLSSAGALSYTWSPGGQFTSSITVTPSATTNYTVTGMNSVGCTDTAIVPVTVNQPPAFTLSSNSPLCTGSTLNLSASNAAGAMYSWSGPNGFSSSLQNPSVAAATVADSGWYYSTATGTNGCSRTDSIFAVVSQNPTAFATASGATTFCQGDSVTLTATNGSSYLWNTGATTQSIAVTSTGNYYCTVSSPNGCSGNAVTSSVSVTVHPNPSTPSIVQNMNVLASTVQGSLYQWYLNGTLQPQNTQFINITPNDNGIWYVTVTNTYGCSTTSAWFYSSVGIDDAAGNDVFDIYPNPSTGRFVVKMKSTMSGQISIEVCNVLGEAVYTSSITVQHNEIDLSGQAAGIYFLKVKNGSVIATRKIIIRN